MSFNPIAIVGQGCVLPGALSPEEYWELLSKGQTAIRPAERGLWRLDHDRMICPPGGEHLDRTVTDHGGYVVGFESRFNPTGFLLNPDEIQTLEPSARWLLECSRQSLGNCSFADVPADRQSLIIGNLGYPTAMQSRRGETVWLEANGFSLDGSTATPSETSRSCEGNLADLVARCLGIRGAAYTIDAACASSLYAIDLACQALHDHRADLVLAGGTNNSDDLFLHVGFTALRALSPTGFSRPFSQQADGLIPAHGAALVALKRLDDAVHCGDPILGVIRGIGLSNDGRSGGFLSPSQSGQIQAIRMAFERAELSPADVQFVECHATGTQVGDAVELAALQEIFGKNTSIGIGSHKGNIGHSITVAGAAGLIKLLGMFRHRSFVPSIPATNRRADAMASPLRVHDRLEEWRNVETRRAGLSAFGFGGANAHLIVEEWIPGSSGPRQTGMFDRLNKEARNGDSGHHSSDEDEVVIVAASVLTGSTESWQEFVQSLERPVSGQHATTIQSFRIPTRELGFPPRDLEVTLPQQVAVMSAVQQVLAESTVPANRTAVFVGTDVESEIARFGARWRLPELIAEDERHRRYVTGEWIHESQNKIIPAIEPAAVTGTMPNIPAHRINVKYDLKGAGYTVSAGSLSGIRSLQIAAGALRKHDIDAAIVGAVDLCSEPVHEHIARLVPERQNATPGDGVVVFLLKRRGDARSAGDSILGSLRVEEIPASNTKQAVNSVRDELRARFGHCGAAAGLLEVAAECARISKTGRARIEFASTNAATMSVELRHVASTSAKASPPRSAAPDRYVTFPAHPRSIVFTPLIPVAESSAQVATPPMLSHQSFAYDNSSQSVNPDPIVGLHEQYIQELTRTHQMFLAGKAKAMRALQARRNVAAAPYVEYETPEPVARERSIPAPLPPAAPLPTASALPKTVTPQAPKVVQASAPPVKPASVEPNPKAPIAAPVKAKEATAHKEDERRTPKGPCYNREQLEILAGGKISSVFGPLFESQDAYRRQVRLPMPPLLLVDRVTGIEAEPGRSGVGTIWTETDVKWDSWYLHEGTMPAGVMIESGQADLLLISWMGADFLNRDQRVYRLLGCEATYFGSLPRPGETLCYQITIDGHARQGDIRLFFFHYDCYVNDELRLRVRHGQAGFFSEKELKETDGILWTPESRDLSPARIDPPTIPCQFTQFAQSQLDDFYAGNMSRCFGPGFEALDTHSRTPRIGGPDLAFIQRITQFETAGGPWKRGYLRAERTIRPDDWYFAGHFLNDPCMPGTLMFEACLQAMSFYLTGLGFTSTHDGWQFEPVDNANVGMQCRGQVTPESNLLTIEILVEEVIYEPDPILYADLLCTVDGVKAFYARRMGLRLAPNWPLSSFPIDTSDKSGVHRGNLRGDYRAFLECAWGRPSEVFGPSYEPFDRYRRTPRLPGPPYHFINRATRIDAEPDDVRPNAEVDVEYDVPSNAWYFDDTDRPTMPLSVLMEVILQPCGWLAMMSGVVLRAKQELFFRNLDGKATVFTEVTPRTGTMRTKVRLVKASTVGETTIMFFDTECHAGATLIARIETSFGFFTRASLAQQVGVPIREDERALMATFREMAPSTVSTENDLFGTRVPMLRMSDRLLDFSTDGGRNGKGRICAEQIVARSAWYFKAHFYQDSVQPGSLGVQALVNLLTLWLNRTHGHEYPAPHFEPIACDEQMVWTYRGQVVPKAKLVHQCVELIEVKRDERGITAFAEGTLWADGLCIYRLPRFAIRMTGSQTNSPVSTNLAQSRVVDPVAESWWNDHCPTYSVPAMPMMGIANEMARAALTIRPNGRVVGIRELRLESWLILKSNVKLGFQCEVIEENAETGSSQIRVQLRAGEPGEEKSIAVGTILLADDYPATMLSSPSIEGLIEGSDPYEDASLFHGPQFQLVQKLWSGPDRSVVQIFVDGCKVPTDVIHPVLLDAALHGVPHSNWSRWVSDIKSGQAGFPIQLDQLNFYGPVPVTGHITAEARLIGGKSKFQTYPIEVEIAVDGRVWARMTYQEKLFPKGIYARASLPDLRRYIRDGSVVQGLELSHRDGTSTRLTPSDIAAVNWLPGTVEHIYKINAGGDLTTEIAVREHVAADWSVHPSSVDWNESESCVRLHGDPSKFQRVSVTREGAAVVVRSL